MNYPKHGVDSLSSDRLCDGDVEPDEPFGLVDLLVRLLPLPLGHPARPEGALVVNVDVTVLEKRQRINRLLGETDVLQLVNHCNIQENIVLSKLSVVTEENPKTHV